MGKMSRKNLDSPQSALSRLYPLLMELWIVFVLFAFFVVRVLGSSLGQRLIAFARLRLSR